MGKPFKVPCFGGGLSISWPGRLREECRQVAAIDVRDLAGEVGEEYVAPLSSMVTGGWMEARRMEGRTAAKWLDGKVKDLGLWGVTGNCQVPATLRPTKRPYAFCSPPLGFRIALATRAPALPTLDPVNPTAAPAAPVLSRYTPSEPCFREVFVC